MAAVNKPKSEVNPRLLVRPQKSQPTCCHPLGEDQGQRQAEAQCGHCSALRPSALAHTKELGLKGEECKQYLESLTGRPTC